MVSSKLTATAVAAGLLAVASADSSSSTCPTILMPSYDLPVVGNGWTAQLIASGLTSPRRLLFDSNGSLLVVEAGKGVTRLTLTDYGGTCLVVANKTTVIANTALNHGLALSESPSILLASSSEAVYGYSYNAASGKVLGTPKTLVEGMSSSSMGESSSDLATRSILLSQKQKLTLVVARGIDSGSDTDELAALSESAGLAQVRVFDLSPLYVTTASSTVIPDNPFEFSADTSSSIAVLGWGVRHAAGLAEHPSTGGIFSTENSVANATYNGVDVHTTNPGDELNYHGVLSNSTGVSTPGGGNYGYPRCFAVADPSTLSTSSSSSASSLAVGDQFSMTQNSTLNDTTCATDYVAPTLTFDSHASPQDLLFSTDGATAYVALHGSDSGSGVETGYAVGSIAFDNATGLPTASSSSTTFFTNILSNNDISKCPRDCFRPVGLAWDASGRLYVSSDTTGEIYVLSRSASSTTSGSGTLVTTTASASTTMPTTTATAAAGNAASSQFQHTTAALGVGIASVVIALLLIV
ncbi:hypothetical protein SBRCBS47491_002127 [Sporothrix bragantina]|uniref:Pyrroloquinoline quinone-dependent pyranose dehydrogenase beta-propeller domain-containing protein n=1 Tax=Sporothrix bragantina TaxID=671064 RepID=A0ABP0B4D3_9PEZI